MIKKFDFKLSVQALAGGKLNGVDIAQSLNQGYFQFLPNILIDGINIEIQTIEQFPSAFSGRFSLATSAFNPLPLTYTPFVDPSLSHNIFAYRNMRNIAEMQSITFDFKNPVEPDSNGLIYYQLDLMVPTTTTSMTFSWDCAAFADYHVAPSETISNYIQPPVDDRPILPGDAFVKKILGI